MKRRWPLAGGVIAIGLAVIAACSTFEGAPPGPTEPEAGGPDAPAETATDSPPPSEGGPSGFCARLDGAAFCADFDVGSLTDGWEVLGDAGAFTTTPSDRSKPNALRVTATVPSDAGKDGDAEPSASPALIKKLAHVSGPSGKRVTTLEMDVRIDDMAPESTFALLGGVGFDLDGRFVSMFGVPGTLSVIVADSARASKETSGALPIPAAGVWFHVKLEVTFGSGTRLWIDDKLAFQTVEGLADETKDYFLIAGNFIERAGAESRVSYDNVTLVETP